jgi:hypothetical protein
VVGRALPAKSGRVKYSALSFNLLLVSTISDSTKDADRAAGTAAAQPHLRRKLGILNATSINMSDMIGIGPFINVPLILGTLGGPQALLSWFVGAIIAMADGPAFSGLGACLSGSGGAYIFLRDSHGRERWGKGTSRCTQARGVSLRVKVSEVSILPAAGYKTLGEVALLNGAMH